MTTPTALAPRSHQTIEALATSPTVPPQFTEAFTQEDWDAMTVPARVAALEFLADEVADTTQGLDITFPRVKYPTAGASFWEVPSADGEPEAVKELEGVVVFKQPVRAYWPIEQEPGKNPPTCSSLDAERPVEGTGKQATNCRTCPHAQWGSGKDQRGQGCKARLNVFLLREGQDIPTLLSLPPSSLKAFSEYAVQLRQSRVALVGVATVFGLTKATSGGGIDYKALTLRIGKKLPYSEMKRAADIRTIFEAQMAKRGVKDEAEEAVPDTPGTTQLLDAGGKVVA